MHMHTRAIWQLIITPHAMPALDDANVSSALDISDSLSFPHIASLSPASAEAADVPRMEIFAC
jgi:hypothetical protein